MEFSIPDSEFKQIMIDLTLIKYTNAAVLYFTKQNAAYRIDYQTCVIQMIVQAFKKNWLALITAQLPSTIYPIDLKGKS